MAESLKLFYLERDFYSNPQVVLIAARDKVQAKGMLNELLAGENYPSGNFGELKEFVMVRPHLFILNPPGDRHFDR